MFDKRGFEKAVELLNKGNKGYKRRGCKSEEKSCRFFKNTFRQLAKKNEGFLSSKSAAKRIIRHHAFGGEKQKEKIEEKVKKAEEFKMKIAEKGLECIKSYA